MRLRPSPIALSLAAAALAGTAAATDLQTLPVPELQRVFLRCEREAGRALMDFGEAATCSQAYEELLRRGFDGDFKRLLAWWQAQRATALAAAPRR